MDYIGQTTKQSVQFVKRAERRLKLKKKRSKVTQRMGKDQIDGSNFSFRINKLRKHAVTQSRQCVFIEDPLVNLHNFPQYFKIY